jgi:DNA-binding NarL/FixJ family response regulator
LADDSSEFLKAARRFLETQPIDIVGEAHTGREALSLIEALAPELLLLDLEMPGLNGLAVLRRLKARQASLCVIVVTLHDLDEYRAAALGAGADGFVAKRELTTALLPMIRQHFGRASGGPLASGGCHE